VLHELPASEITWDLQPAPVDPSLVTNASDILAEAVIDALSYRLIVQASFDYLRHLTLQLDRERAQRLRLLDEYRAFRARQLSATTNLPDRPVDKSTPARVREEVTPMRNLPDRVTGKDGKSHPASSKPVMVDAGATV
jgi:hypothetical protein